MLSRYFVDVLGLSKVCTLVNNWKTVDYLYPSFFFPPRKDVKELIKIHMKEQRKMSQESTVEAEMSQDTKITQ